MEHLALKHGDAAEILQGCAGVVYGTVGTTVTPAQTAVSHCESAELLLTALKKNSVEVEVQFTAK